MEGFRTGGVFLAVCIDDDEFVVGVVLALVILDVEHRVCLRGDDENVFEIVQLGGIGGVLHHEFFAGGQLHGSFGDRSDVHSLLLLFSLHIWGFLAELHVSGILLRASRTSQSRYRRS